MRKSNRSKKRGNEFDHISDLMMSELIDYLSDFFAKHYRQRMQDIISRIDASQIKAPDLSKGWRIPK